MKWGLIISVAAAALLGLSVGLPGPVIAQQTTTDPNNTIETVQVLATYPGGGAVEGEVIYESISQGNTINDPNSDRSTLIDTSFNGNLGIISINQDTGNDTNQANVRVLAIIEVSGFIIQDINFWGLTKSYDNTIIASDGPRQNKIAHSLKDTVGIVGVTQSSGNLKQMANLLVLGMGLTIAPGGFWAIADGELGAESSGNVLPEADPTGPRHDIIEDSFTGFRGVRQIIQSSGDLNIANSGIAVSFNVLTIP